MSIKFRLLLSNIAMLVIPIILSFAAFHFVGGLYINEIKHYYNISGRGSFFRDSILKENPLRDITEQNNKIFMDIRKYSVGNPEILKNKQFLSELDKNLKKMNTAIIVRKDDSIVYSSESTNKDDILNNLPKFGSFIEYGRNHSLITNQLLIYKQNDFYFSDKSKGSVFLITDAGPMVAILKKLTLTLVVIVLLILIITDIILTLLVSRSIINPLKALKIASNKIKEGNLDFQVKSYSNDEIGELCSEFEDMRFKLKELSDIQFQYENNRKELISNISHDLKTPITAVKGYVEGIRDGVADTPEKLDKYINTIYIKSCDIDKLIDELLLYSKLDLNKLPFQFEEVNICSYLKDSMEELQFDLEKKNIKLSLTGDVNKELFVLADRERLKRVIINIIENAVKYMDKKLGKINIDIKDDGKRVIIRVEDNGQGIDLKSLPFIFDRFYRADESRNSSTGGSGLGLAIAKKIIEEHGGIMWAESSIGEGTSIFFTLKSCTKGQVKRK